MSKSNVPKYRSQKRKGRTSLAFVEVDGQRVYLGVHGSPDSREAYARVIAEMAAGGGHLPTKGDNLTINELVARFWEHAEAYYRRPDGTLAHEVASFRLAVRPLVELFGRTEAAAFGPSGLKAVRARMVDIGWSRPTVNHQVVRLRHLFKWGASEELVPVSVYHTLQVVPGLKRGRTKAPEPEPVRPVSDATVATTLAYMTPTVQTMVRVQRLTGMRPGEVCIMRACDLDTSGKVWTYTPEVHKMAYRGRPRTIYIGPEAQTLLVPMLPRSLKNYIFSPIQSESERLTALHANRVTPMSCGNAPGTNRVRNPKSQPGERFTPDGYRKSIAYACRQAFPAPDEMKGADLEAWHKEHRWSPNQIRHTFATEVRREHGLEAAQVLLGHSQADVTQIYAERDSAHAVRVIAEVG